MSKKKGSHGGAAHAAPAGGGGAAHAAPAPVDVHAADHHDEPAKGSRFGVRSAVFAVVAIVGCGWFFWPRLSAIIGGLRTSDDFSERLERRPTQPTAKPPAPPDVPVEAKSEGFNPLDINVTKGLSEALSAPVRWLDKHLPAEEGAKKEAQSRLPRPPEGVIEVHLKPGVIVWQKVMGRGEVSPWFEMFGAVRLHGDSSNPADPQKVQLGRQTWEPYPGNPHIGRIVEIEGALMRVSGEVQR